MAKRANWISKYRIVLGLLLFLMGVIVKNRRERVLGLATIGLSLIAGIS
jgi:hypothetical protein